MPVAQSAIALSQSHRDIYTARDANDANAALDARLSRLAAALADDECRTRLCRTPGEEQDAQLVRRPLTTEQAFARFGLLVGTLPPAAIFTRILIVMSSDSVDHLLPALFAATLLTCAFLGRQMGARLCNKVEELERGSWVAMMIGTIGYAAVWAAATGAAGGAVFFGIGAIIGFLCALPVALIAFALFVPLHRLLARGGMIDARHFYPLAWGINLTIAAMILSPHLFTY